MPNNFVFDVVAQDLKSLMYGLWGDTTAVALAVDENGNLNIGVGYTSSNTEISGITAATTGIALTMDSSEKNLYSFYVTNTSTTSADIQFKLQVAPTDVATYYTDDSSTVYTVAAGSMAVLVPKYYLHYTRLYYVNGSDTGQFEAYYDARE